MRLVSCFSDFNEPSDDHDIYEIRDTLSDLNNFNWHVKYIHKGQKPSKEDENVTEQIKETIWVIAKQCVKIYVEPEILEKAVYYASVFLEDSRSVWTMFTENINDHTVQEKIKFDVRVHRHPPKYAPYISLLKEIIFELEVVHID